MKICCFIYSLAAGGAQRVMVNLANHWANLDYEITIVTYDEGELPFFEVDKRIKLLQLKLSGGSLSKRVQNQILRIPMFRKVIKNWKPDIVVSFIDRTNVLVLLASLGTGIPIIVSERTDPRLSGPGLPYSLLRPLFYRRSSAVVALSKEQADWLSKYSKNVHVIGNPLVSTFSAKQGMNRRTKKIIAAGRLSKEKGFDRLIEAFSLCCKENPKWKLEIYGEGSERKSLENKILALNLSGKVRLPGLTKSLDQHLRSAGLFVLSSQYEGFPCVLIEAMANECPSIAVKCTDTISEIVQNGKNGIVVSPNNVEKLAEAMAKMMSDNQYRLMLSGNGSNVLERFNIESISGRWERLFESVTR